MKIKFNVIFILISFHKIILKKPKKLFPEGDNFERLKLGRYFGLDHFDVGSLLCGRELTANKRKFAHSKKSYIFPMSPEDEHSDLIKERK